MSRTGVWWVVLAAIALSGCSLSGQEHRPQWTSGFWFWHGSTARGAVSDPVDVLFVHVGSIQADAAYGQWPDELPAAREYWVTFRFEKQGVPDLRAAPKVAQEVVRLRTAAQKRGLAMAGVQLDIDSPTGSLPQYAAFLKEVRKGLPREVEISITALLDWFRGGTAIAQVIAETDEFVPQFYDVSDRGNYNGGQAIAAPIDAARWGPVFNRFGKRFRVGVSTFGRARATGALYGDLVPIDIAANPAFQLQASRNSANELVLTYRAARKATIGYNDFAPGDTAQFILATPDAVKAAVESVRQMGGHSAGVVFFRWPGSNEPLTMQPNEALTAAGLRPADRQPPNLIHTVNGRCAAVECVDLYFESAAPFAPVPVRYRIRSSTELEYFLPEKNVPVRMAGPSELQLSLPAYCARGRFFLGRAVSSRRAEFTVTEGR